MSDNANELVLSAQDAVAHGHTHAAEILFLQALEEDLGNREAWQGLYDLSPKDKRFHEFKREFIAEHFVAHGNSGGQAQAETFVFNRKAIYWGLFASCWTGFLLVIALVYFQGRGNYSILTNPLIWLLTALAGWIGGTVGDAMARKNGNPEQAGLYGLAWGAIIALVLVPMSVIFLYLFAAIRGVGGQ